MNHEINEAQTLAGTEISDLIYDYGISKAFGEAPLTVLEKYKDLIDGYERGELRFVDCVYLAMKREEQKVG